MVQMKLSVALILATAIAPIVAAPLKPSVGPEQTRSVLLGMTDDDFLLTV